MRSDEHIAAHLQIETIEIVVATALQPAQQRALAIARDAFNVADARVLRHSPGPTRSQVNHEAVARGRIIAARVNRYLLAIFCPDIEAIVVLAALSQQLHAGPIRLNDVNLR